MNKIILLLSVFIFSAVFPPQAKAYWDQNNTWVKESNISPQASPIELARQKQQAEWKKANDEQYKQLIIWAFVLIGLFCVVGGFLGLNLLVIWTFALVAVLVEIAQMLPGRIGLGFGLFGFFVTFVSALGAAIAVHNKTS